RKMMTSGDRLAQVAAADLLNEVGVSIRGTSDQDRGGVTSTMAQDLIALLKSNSLQVREAAARALGKINPDPTVAAAALGNLLKTPSDEHLHQEAAQSLADMIQVVSSVQTNRMVSGVEANREDVIRTARAVIPAARPALTDLDPRVRRQGLEVVRQAAVAVGELVQDPKKSDELPPSGRPWSAMERMEVD